MGSRRSEEFWREPVKLAVTSGLTLTQIGADLSRRLAADQPVRTAGVDGIDRHARVRRCARTGGTCALLCDPHNQWQRGSIETANG